MPGSRGSANVWRQKGGVCKRRPRPSGQSLVTCSGFIVFGFVALSLAMVATPHSIFKRGVSSRKFFPSCFLFTQRPVLSLVLYLANEHISPSSSTCHAPEPSAIPAVQVTVGTPWRPPPSRAVTGVGKDHQGVPRLGALCQSEPMGRAGKADQGGVPEEGQS